MSTANINIRTDKEVKEAAEKIFEQLGLNMTTAINMFLRQSIRENGIPFYPTLDVPNAITAAAMEEGKRIAGDKNIKGYKTIEELKAALEDEI